MRDLLQDRQGDIWIATESGVARYRPYCGPLAISLNTVADRAYGATSQLTLPASQHFLAFEFSGQRLVKPGKAMLYRYRLEGYDTGWRQTHAGRAEYDDLEPGNYTFSVEAIDNDLNYSERLQVRLTVLPPWYRRPTRVALLAVVLLSAGTGSVVAGRRYVGQRRQATRMRQQQLALYRVRERVWQMMDSTDIDGVVATAAQSSWDLGIRFGYLGVNVIDPRAVERVTSYTLGRDGQWLFHGAQGPPLIIDFWRGQEVVYRPDLHRDDPYGERRPPPPSESEATGSRGGAPGDSSETEASAAEDAGVRQELAGVMAEGTLRSVVDVPFSHGTLAASSTEPEAFSEEDIGTLRELAQVLSEGFRRTDDLRALEQRHQELEDEIAQEHGAEAPKVVAVTASAMEHQRQQYLDEGFDGYIDKPFRREEILAVLGEVLGADFENVAVPGEEREAETPEGELELTEVSLPVELYEGLMQAAKQHNVTELHRCLDALADLGDGEKQLALRLRGLRRQYDMKGIQRVLEDLGRPT